jgi:hypothetical protein
MSGRCTRATTRRQNHRPVAQQARDDALFALPKFSLAALFKNLGNGHAGSAFDFGIRVEKRQAEPLR